MRRTHTGRVATTTAARLVALPVVHPGATADAADASPVTASYRGGDASPASSVGPPVQSAVHTFPYYSARFRPLSRRGGSLLSSSPAPIPPSFVPQILVL